MGAMTWVVVLRVYVESRYGAVSGADLNDALEGNISYMLKDGNDSSPF